MPTGLQEQIDELDQLLDKLLKLPIESARPAPRTIPIPKAPLAVVSETDDDNEEVADRPTTILRFDGEAVQTTKDPEPVEPPVLLAEPSDESNIAPITAPISPIDQGPTIGHVTESPIQNDKLSLSEIPWIEDEPAPHVPGAGPQIEIIHSSTSQTIVANSPNPSQPNPFASRRSLLYWLLWLWTWLFDHTFGYWFPWLRRPGVKFLLGLIGAALCAVSIYLVWIGWRR